MENLSKSMIIDGIASSEAIDTSGEILDVAGCDISDLENGLGILNYEHRGEKSEGASANDNVGAIIFAKKIFKKDDCSNGRELECWNKVKLPFIYFKAELYNDEGHPGAIALAAQIRYYHRRKLPIVVRYSIEGSIVERDGNKLVQSIARKIAATVKPANRSCYSGVVFDSEDPENLVDVLKNSKNPFLFSNGYNNDISILDDEYSELENEIDTAYDVMELSKALAAGGYDMAPSGLSGGAALQTEDRSLRFKRSRMNLLKLYRDWDRKGKFKDFLKNKLDEVDPEFVDYFGDLVDQYQVKKYQKSLDSLRKFETTDASGVEENKLKLPSGSYTLYNPANDINGLPAYNLCMSDPKLNDLYEKTLNGWQTLHNLSAQNALPVEILRHIFAFAFIDDTLPQKEQENIYDHIIYGENNEVQSNLNLLHKLHEFLPELSGKYGNSGKSWVESFVEQKEAAEKWSAKLSANPNIGPFPGIDFNAVPKSDFNDINKMARFLAAMAGCGDIIIPDEHFIRHCTGSNLQLDHKKMEDEIWSNKETVKDLEEWFDSHLASINSPGEDNRLVNSLKHWLAIQPHELQSGKDTKAHYKKEYTSPEYFDSVISLVKSESSDKIPFWTSRTQKELVKKHGLTLSLILYYKNIVPYLLSVAQRGMEKAEKQVKVYKLQKSIENLIKTIEEGLPTIPDSPHSSGAVEYKGKWVNPGKIRYKGKELKLLATEGEHYIVQNPKGGLGKVKIDHPEVALSKNPSEFDGSRYVHGKTHTHPLNTTLEQQQLIHGIDLRDPQISDFEDSDFQTSSTRSSWYKNHFGQRVFVKAPMEEHTDTNYDVLTPDGQIKQEAKPFSTTYAEVSYNNLARNFFGLDKYVPLAAAFKNPKDGLVYSAMEEVKNGTHYHPTMEELNANLKSLGDSGELDKMAIMDYVLGNSDRHGHNFMFDGDNQLKLIDHGKAFEHLSQWVFPSYLQSYHENEKEKFYDPAKQIKKPAGQVRHYAGMIDNAELHPEAQKWVMSLNPQELGEKLAEFHELPDQVRAISVQKLHKLQQVLGGGKTDYLSLFNEQRHPLPYDVIDNLKSSMPTPRP